MCALAGPPVLDEDARIATDSPEPFGSVVRATVEGERMTLASSGIEGVVLRYGCPGTWFHRDGDVGDRRVGDSSPSWAVGAACPPSFMSTTRPGRPCAQS